MVDVNDLSWCWDVIYFNNTFSEQYVLLKYKIIISMSCGHNIINIPRLCNNSFLSLFLSSSVYFWRTWQCGCEICGGSSSETHHNAFRLMKKKIQLYQLPSFNLVYSSTSSENSLVIFEIGSQNQSTFWAIWISVWYLFRWN